MTPSLPCEARFLLGAVVPEMRQQTEVLIADLEDLSRVETSISEEQSRLTATLSSQAEEKKRLDLLLTEKQKMQTTSEATRQAEQQRAEDLAETSHLTSRSDCLHGKRHAGTQEGG